MITLIVDPQTEPTMTRRKRRRGNKCEKPENKCVCNVIDIKTDKD